MRLKVLENGHRPLQKLILTLIKLGMGFRPGPILTMSYRRDLFGKHLAACVQEGMRQMKHWQKTDVEVMAAFVAQTNTCHYCLGDHRAIASVGLPEDVVKATLANWQTAPVGEPLRQTLGFLEKVTLRPTEVGPADVEPLRAAGLRDAAIEEALYVCFLFNVIGRLADAFDFEEPAEKSRRRLARVLYAQGYGIGSLPG
ncbi:MAG: hypothetical protein AB1791_11925 [Chloroflexota bacterium]